MEFDYESFPGDSASSSPIYFSAEVHYAERQKTKLRADGDGFLLPRWYTVQYIYIHIRDDEASWDKHWTLDIWSSFGRHALGLSDLQRLLFCFSGHRQMRDFVVRYGPAFCIEGLCSKLRFGHGKCWARHASVVQQIRCGCRQTFTRCLLIISPSTAQIRRELRNPSPHSISDMSEICTLVYHTI